MPETVDKQYKNPIPTVDIVILMDHHSNRPMLEIPGRGILGRKFIPDYDVVLIKRKNPPHGWALPGGFVEEGEHFYDAARREAMEETGLSVTIEHQLYTYSSPFRDPRKHIISTAFIAYATGTPKAADDAVEIIRVPLSKVHEENLVFDHKSIVVHTRRYLMYGTRPDGFY